VRRETGNESSVQVRRDEGVATHIGPEPCAAVREGGLPQDGDCGSDVLSLEATVRELMPSEVKKLRQLEGKHRVGSVQILSHI
jgi:hypothetical protein